MLALEEVLCAVRGIRRRKKDIRPNIGLSFPLIHPLSVHLSLDCPTPELLLKSLHVVVLKELYTLSSQKEFLFWSSKTLCVRELCETTCSVERVWRGFVLSVDTPRFFSCGKTEANAATPAVCLLLLIMVNFSEASISSIR